MILDAALALQAVRLTARTSAVLVGGNMIVAARRLRSDQGAWRTADVVSFAAFIASHTVHFFCLILLASATGGQSIRDSGGWTPAVVVATIFYLGCGAVIRVKLRPGTGWRTRGQRRTEASILGVLWLVFFQAYAGRPLASPWFASLTVGLLYALLNFIVAGRKSSLVPADPNVLQSV